MGLSCWMCFLKFLLSSPLWRWLEAQEEYPNTAMRPHGAWLLHVHVEIFSSSPFRRGTIPSQPLQPSQAKIMRGIGMRPGKWQSSCPDTRTWNRTIPAQDGYWEFTGFCLYVAPPELWVSLEWNWIWPLWPESEFQEAGNDGRVVLLCLMWLWQTSWCWTLLFLQLSM